MTRREHVQQLVANVMGEPSPKSGRIAINRIETILLCTCACTLLEHKIFLFALKINRLIQPGTLIWLPSTLILDILIVGLVYYFLTLPTRWSLTTQIGTAVSKLFAILVAFFAIISTCASMVLLIETGHELKWKLAFEVELSSTKSLFVPQIPLFAFILILQPIVGTLNYLLIHLWLSRKKSRDLQNYIPLFNASPTSHKSSRSRVKAVFLWLFRWKFVLLGSIYLLLLIILRPNRPWNALSNNPIGGFFWTLFHVNRPRSNRVNIPPPTWDQNFVSFISQQISAAPVDLAKPPRAYLKNPIRNVVIINLESTRADVLPFSHEFVRAVGTKLVHENLTAEDLTPFWTSLMPDSLIMTDTSATSSYTLKTLLTTFCGMYPLNVNFMEEGREDHHFYQECLPQVVRRYFPSQNGKKRLWQRSSSSRFRSAFFQSSDNTFDHQAEEFEKMGWDERFYGSDVEEFVPGAAKMGWFGVGDGDLLPLFFNWVDKTLSAKKQVLAGILTTSTHFPFPLPDGEHYRPYVKEDIVNRYLNSIRKADDWLRDVVTGFESRGILNETMFIMLGDHGHAFDDWDHKILGALDNPMENGFKVPFMVYSPALVSGGLVEGRFTNMDVLPTVMDALLASSQDPSWNEEYPSLPPEESFSQSVAGDNKNTTNPEIGPDKNNMPRATGNLLDLNGQQLVQVEYILNRYEGTSIFRPPLDPNHPQRMTFHLDNPGNAHVIIVQYPLKLVYDAIGEQTYLYDLSHDYREWEDLLSLPFTRGNVPPPSWVDWTVDDLAREFNFRWWLSGVDEFEAGRTAPDRDISIQYVKPDNETSMKDQGMEDKLDLGKAFDWAEDAFEILLGWSWTNRERYLTGRMKVDILRSTALESLRGDGRTDG